MARTATVGILRVLLTANSAEFDAAMKKAAGTAKTLTKDFTDIGRQATQLGTALTKTLTLPLAGLGVTAAKLAIDFESSFAGVRKTVQATEPEFAKLAQGLRDLAKTIPINVNELNRIAAAAGQLGIDKENIVAFTETIAKLGVTTNLSSDEAASALARLANITQMNQADFGRLGSTIVALGNRFATTEAEIVDFGLRIAGAGKIAGLTEAQILAIGTAMSSVGVQAEAGGTAVQKVLNDMTAAVATGNEQLAVFAKTAELSAEEFSKAFREDAGQAFAAFVAGLGKQGDKAFATLDQLKLGNERVIRAFLSLAGAGDLLTRSLNVASDAWSKNAALSEEARERFKTTQSQLTLLWNRVKDVGITLGNALLPAIQSTIGLFDRLLPLVDGLAKAFAVLPGPIQMVVVGLGLVLAATGPLIFILGQLALSASALTGVFTAKGVAARALTGQFGVLNKATTALTVAWRLLWTPINAATIATAAAAVKQALLTATTRSLTATTHGLTVAMRAAGAAMMALPIASIVAGLGVVAAAVIKLRERYQELGESAAKSARAIVAAQGQQGQVKVAEQLAQKERELAEAIRDGNRALAARLQAEVNALKTDQTRMAMLDTINKAIQQGAAKTITYAEAVKFNAEKERERVAATKAGAKAITDGAAATAGAAAATDTFTAKLKAAQAELATFGREHPEKLADLKRAIDSNVFSLDDLQKQSGLSELAFKLLSQQFKDTEKAAKRASSWLSEFKDQTAELASKIAAAEKAGAAMPVLLDLFGEAAKTASERADAWGVTVEDSVERVAAAFKDAELQKAIKDLMDDAAKEAARLVSEMQKSGEEAGRRLVAGLRESNADFLSTLTDMQRRWIALEGDTLDARIRLIQLEFSEKRKALDQYSTFYEDHLRLLNAEEAKALEDARKKWDEELKARKTSFSQLLTDLSNSLSNLAQVANGALGSVARGFATIVAAIDTVLKSVAQLTKGLKSIGKDFLSGLTSILSGGFGLFTGLFSIGKSLFGGLAKLFGRGDDGDKERDEFIDAMGGFDALARRLHAAGRSDLFQRLLNAKSGKSVVQVVEEINKVLGELDKQLGVFNQSLTPLLQEVADLGGQLPDSLRGYLDSLRQAGQLTEENIALLDALAGGGEVSWQKMQELAEKYGISVDSLGQRFQEQRLHEGWQEIIDDLDTLERGGADMTAVLIGMSDEINELVQDSIQFGTTIPENMRPWIEKMIEMGLLLDENGDKITDIGQLTFGETLQTSLQKLIATIENLIKTLGGIPTEVNIDVNYRERNRPEPLPRDDWIPDGSEIPGHAATGGLMSRLGRIIPASHFQMGGIAGRLVSWLPKGTDRHPAMLSAGEVVLNEGQQANIADSLHAAMQFVDRVKAETMAATSGVSLGPGAFHAVTILEVDKREIARAVSDVLPGELRRLGVRVRS